MLSERTLEMIREHSTSSEFKQQTANPIHNIGFSVRVLTNPVGQTNS